MTTIQQLRACLDALRSLVREDLDLYTLGETEDERRIDRGFADALTLLKRLEAEQGRNLWPQQEMRSADGYYFASGSFAVEEEDKQ